MNIQEIQTALMALGSTPEEVYTSLKEKGIRGRPKLPCECPIANYLKQVSGHTYQVTNYSAYPDGFDSDNCVIIPQPVRQFILHFDRKTDFQDLLG
jgi:hypothetical protein